MNGIMLLLLLLAVVFLLLIFPIKKRRIDFDEKGEAIKVYEEEVAHITRQFEKGFINKEEKTQLLAELDKKSALAITAIDKKSFAYKPSFVPLVLIVAGLAVASLVYYRHYQQSGVMRWQAFNERFRGTITEGLFDVDVVNDFISQKDAKTNSAYCFSMQRELLAKYDTNPDALANLASCYMTVGYPQLAEQAIERGLNSKADHTDLNYLVAELQYTKDKRLNKASIDRLMTVVKLAPDHFRAIRLLAINSLNQGNYGQAKFFFTQLRQLAPDNDMELLSALDRLLGEIDGKMAESGQTVMPSPISPNHPPISNHPPINAQASSQVNPHQNKAVASEKAPVAEAKTAEPSSQSASSDSSPTADKVAIKVSVKLDPDLDKTLSGDNVLFVIVKTPQGKLLNATKHVINANNQPLAVTVTDDIEGMMKMEPMSGISVFSVVARISRNNSPIATTGDLTSVPVTVKVPQDKPAPIVIDQKVP